MRRITLYGKGLENFPEDADGAYVKLIFPSKSGNKPALRTYTIANQRYQDNEIDIDFVIHKDIQGKATGIAAPWALAAKPGDEITVAGPGPAGLINFDADYFLMAADMTALPALAANLKRLPDGVEGHACIEILSEKDIQELKKPENVNISWIVNDRPGSDESPLYHNLANISLPRNRIAAWAACEFITMKKIRSYLKDELGLGKSHRYTSSYWKLGNTEEQHKIAKQLDAISN